MSEMANYDEAVRLIKTAILQSQYAAVKSLEREAVDALLRDREIHFDEFS